MARLPPVNATLTKVQGPDLEDGTPGVVKWEGTAPAFVTEQVVVGASSDPLSPGSVFQERERTRKVARLVVPSYVAVASGDRLSWEKGGESTTRTARNLEDRSDFGFTRVFLKEEDT